MCGRFVQSEPPHRYADYFGAELREELAPNYNVAPTDQVYAVAEHDGKRLLGTFKWGLVPFWAKSEKIGARHINARAETIAEKPAFRDVFTSRRCIVPADGFYEWERLEDGTKLPHFIHRSGGGFLGLAGLWSSWRHPDSNERLVTCTIITTEPNELVEPIHDRMPVVLPQSAWATWLDRGNDDVAELQKLLVPLPSGQLDEYTVSTLVNNVRNNFPECVAPLT